MNFIKNFLLFSRLHTVIGTTLSIFALYLIALSFSNYQYFYLTELALSLLSCLGANIYIVGLNQITDVEIDKINKPWLPLASGAFSMRGGYMIITVSVLISMLIAGFFGNYLLLTVLLSLILGTAYSLPPFRLKRYYFWASFCIIAVRGFIVNLLLFLHFQFIINGLHSIPFVVWLLTATMFAYSIIIAWYKDIPDMEGDRRFHIRTLSLRLGAENVFRIGSILITGIYLFLIAAPIILSLEINTWLFSGTHILMLALFWRANFRLDLTTKSSIQRYYQFIWVLFFLEYITFALTAFIR